MTTYSQLTDVERRKVLDLAHTVIEDANAGRYDASQLEALAARTRAATPSQGSEQALQIADAIDTLAAQMRAGRLPGRFHDPETLKKPIYTPVAELDDKQRRLVEQTALEEIAFFGAAGDPAAIERLAAQGRLQDWSPGMEGHFAQTCTALAWQVSDVMDDIAARMRAGQAVIAGFAALGPVVRLMVRS